MRYVWVLAVVCLMAGCKRESAEATYKGRTEGDWVRLSHDSDSATRYEAYKALAAIQTPTAKAALSDGLKDPSPELRQACQVMLNGATGVSPGVAQPSPLPTDITPAERQAARLQEERDKPR